LHPRGVVFSGAFASVPDALTTGSPLFAPGVRRQALVRISRGAGLPDALPDVRGCAIRVVDAHGEGEHQDFLLASSLAAPGGRHLLLPGWSFGGAFYSSVLLYGIGARRLLLGARVEGTCGKTLKELEAAVERGRARVHLCAAAPFGGWREVARLDIESNALEAQTLRFNPWVTGGAIRPLGPLMGLRDPAYRASQAATPGS
jgi:hypothetical protein